MRRPTDEQLLLAHQLLEMRAVGLGQPLPFDAFLRDWRALRIDQRGRRTLSLWRGPDRQCVALLTGGAPDWPLLAITDFSPEEIQPKPQPRHASFLLPGDPMTRWGECFAKFGLFVGCWPDEGATGLRLTRLNQQVQLTSEEGAFILIDWDDPAPVQRFDAIDLPGLGWLAPLAPWLPYGAGQVWDAYRRHNAALRQDPTGPARNDQDSWASDLVSDAGADWVDIAIAMMGAANAARDLEALNLFGALIYGNDAAFFDRLGREIDAGRLAPQVVGAVIAMERPEYLDAASLASFRRLSGRCGG